MRAFILSTRYLRFVQQLEESKLLTNQKTITKGFHLGIL